MEEQGANRIWEKMTIFKRKAPNDQLMQGNKDLPLPLPGYHVASQESRIATRTVPETYYTVALNLTMTYLSISYY